MATKAKKTVKKVAKKVVKPVKAVKVAPRKSKISAAAKSFQIAKDRTPFMTYQITQQTIFWAILFVYIMILSLWILNIQLDTLRIIDRINTL